MKCSKCGKELAANVKFCTGCGTPVEANTQEKKQENKETNFFSETHKSNGKHVKTMIIIGVIAVLAVVIVFIAKGMDKKDKSEGPAYEYTGEENGQDRETSDSDFQDEDSFMNQTEDTEDETWNGYPEMESYILPGSDTRYLTIGDLEGLTAEQCRIARNEIYARHGRMFDDEALQAYFLSQEWYRPTIKPEDFKEDMLNTYETANRDFIVEYEEAKGYR